MLRRYLVQAVWMLAFGCCPLLAQNLPAGFQRTDPIVSRVLPTGVYFAHDGRVFVTEKSGKIWLYQNLLATTPQLFADLSLEVHDNWDRGLLGFSLDPRFPEAPYVYVQYAYNGGLGLGGPLPRWPTCPANNPTCGVNNGTDYCPDPPGDTTNYGGCVISGRVSKLTITGNAVSNEQVLVEDWYQQFPSHSIGTIKFGPDGYLYAGGGDGASFNDHDFGQWGNLQYPDQRSPLNPGNPNDQATNQGGSLRAQGLEIESVYNGNGHDVWVNGSIIRIDPNSGAGAPGNPLAGDPQPNAQRIIAYGLRNPFRFTFRPGTAGDLWVGDVGENNWEEINRIPAVPAAGGGTLLNFGWPCYEGRGHHAGFTGGPICTALYSNGDAGGRTPQTPPWYTYDHSHGGSDITGLAFYEGTAYPAQYQNSLFFSDNSRQIIFNIPFIDANGDGVPDPPADSSATAFFGGAAATSVQLTSGPGGDIFFTNINSGKISRISYCTGCSTASPGNVAPSAAIALDSGSIADGAPRTIGFSAANSVDPNNLDTLSWSWDLNGDGNFGDATGVTASAFYGANGVHKVSVQVSDGHGGVDVASMVITVVNGAPTVTITSPNSSTLWSSDQTIALTATSSDPEQGVLPDSALAWQVYREDCTNPDFTGCTESVLGNFTGSSTSFVAPGAAFPAYLRIVLTGTDNGGLSDTKEVDIYPATAGVTLASVPAGLALLFNGASAAAPHTHTVIVNAGFEVGAASPQALGGTQYDFVAWSDGGAATHTAHALTPGPATLTATFAAPADIAVALDDGLAVIAPGQSVTWMLTVDNPGVNSLSGVGVTATLPAMLLGAHWTCTSTSGSSCTASGSGAPNDSASIASGGRVTYQISATVALNASGSLTVSASAVIPAGYVNQSPGNDSASDTDAVLVDVIFRDGFEGPH